MRIGILRMSVGWMAMVLVALATGAPAASITYDFDTPGDLDLHFTRVTNYTGSGTPIYSESTDGGINNTRSVYVTQQSQYETRYEKASFPAHLDEWTMSVYLRHVTATNSATTPALGIGVANQNTVIPANASASTNASLWVGLSSSSNNVFHLRIFSHNGAGTLTQLPSDTFSLTSGNWYFMEGTFARRPDEKYDITVTLSNALSDGTVGSSVMTFAQLNVTDSDWLSDPGASGYAFAHSVASARARGLDRFDDFTIPIPEPSTATLMLLALAGARWVRRRR